MQINKAEFDMRMELRKLNRQTIAIVITAIGVVIAAFGAGAAWWNFFGHHTP